MYAPLVTEVSSIAGRLLFSFSFLRASPTRYTATATLSTLATTAFASERQVRLCWRMNHQDRAYPRAVFPHARRCVLVAADMLAIWLQSSYYLHHRWDSSTESESSPRDMISNCEAFTPLLSATTSREWGTHVEIIATDVQLVAVWSICRAIDFRFGRRPRSRLC
jgi:hypothetical protein